MAAVTASAVTVAEWPLGIPPSPNRRCQSRRRFTAAYRMVLITCAVSHASSAPTSSRFPSNALIRVPLFPRPLRRTVHSPPF